MPEYATKKELRMLMKKYRLTARMVSEMLGMQPQSIRMWMCGVRPVPAYALKMIRLTLGD